MRFRRKRESPGVVASENGFFEAVGRQSDLPLRDMFVHFRDLVSADMTWADNRKRRYRRRTSWLRAFALGLTAASTVVLGIDAIPDRERWALPLVALVTVVTGMEALLSWRSTWALMVETQYRLNRLRDEMDFHLVSTPTKNLTLDQLKGFFDEHQTVWAEVSDRWVGFHRVERQPSQA